MEKIITVILLIIQDPEPFLSIRQKSFSFDHYKADTWAVFWEGGVLGNLLRNTMIVMY